MVKMIIVILSVLSLVLAEPPLGDGYEQAHRQYLPPDFNVPSARTTKSSYNDLSRQYQEAGDEISQEYGPPSFRNEVSQVYGAPLSRNNPSSTYGVPSTRNSIPNAHIGQHQSNSGISQVYGVPSSRNSISDVYGAPVQRVSQQYGVPDIQGASQQYTLPRSNIQTPVQKYGVPRFSQSSSSSRGSTYAADAFKSFGLKNQGSFTPRTIPQTYGTPARSLSNQYGTPETRIGDSYSNALSRSPSTYGTPKSQQKHYEANNRNADEETTALVSSYSQGRSSSAQEYDATHSDGAGLGYAYSRNALEELLNQEPASYEFGYKVSDYTSGSDFGHAETRQAERAEGSYFVVLPDGSKQVVEYEADERGFKPRISVEAPESGPY
ncbi:pro-resilin-like [Battus philenor]|uniref:pro-resilin-like n=1 Tax=Battus philenor TaxID=42288 RepID=UPI0035D0F1F5